MIQYLIGTVLKKGLVNIVYGPSGANKTTWVLQLLSAMATQTPFLGEFPINHDLPTTHYIALDRPAEELEDKLMHFNIGTKGKFTYESHFANLKELHNVEAVLQRVPIGTKLLIMDGIGFVVDGKKLIEQRSIGILMSECYKWCQRNGATIILIHHTAKAKIGQGYGNAREKAAGSGAWAQTAALSVLIQGTEDDIESPNREAFIMQNNLAGRRLELVMTENGLVIKENLAFDPEGDIEFTRADIEREYPDKPPRTISKWISHWIQIGMFKRVGQGHYKGKFPAKKEELD